MENTTRTLSSSSSSSSTMMMTKEKNFITSKAMPTYYREVSVCSIEEATTKTQKNKRKCKVAFSSSSNNNVQTISKRRKQALQEHWRDRDILSPTLIPLESTIKHEKDKKFDLFKGTSRTDANDDELMTMTLQHLSSLSTASSQKCPNSKVDHIIHYKESLAKLYPHRFATTASAADTIVPSLPNTTTKQQQQQQKQRSTLMMHGATTDCTSNIFPNLLLEYNHVASSSMNYHSRTNTSTANMRNSISSGSTSPIDSLFFQQQQSSSSSHDKDITNLQFGMILSLNVLVYFGLIGAILAMF